MEYKKNSNSKDLFLVVLNFLVVHVCVGEGGWRVGSYLQEFRAYTWIRAQGLLLLSKDLMWCQGSNSSAVGKVNPLISYHLADPNSKDVFIFSEVIIEQNLLRKM